MKTVREGKGEIKYLIYCLLVIMTIYQDSPLGLYLGTFGYSFMPVISIILFVFLGVLKGKIYVNLMVKKLFILLIWLAIVSICSDMIWVISGNSAVLLGEEIFVKSFKVLLYFVSYLCFIICMMNLNSGFTVEKILWPYFIVLIALTVISFVEYNNLPYAFSNLHYNGMKVYGRVRLLTKESSFTTMMIYVYSLLSLYYGIYIKKSKVITVLTIACICILLFFTTSKTLMISLFLTFIIAVLMNLKTLGRKQLIQSAVIVLLALIAYFTIYSTLEAHFLRSVDRSSSVPTRIYTILIGILVGLKYPLGTGTALYLRIFPENLAQYITIFDRLNSDVVLTEIYSFINATSDQYLAVKSGLLQYNMYWGILGTILFLKIINKYVIKIIDIKKDPQLMILKVGFVVVLILIATSLDFTFEFWHMAVAVITIVSIQKGTK